MVRHGVEQGPALTGPAVDYKPRFPPNYRPGVGIVGCGLIVKYAHLTAYEKYGVRVVGVHDVDPDAVAGVQDEFRVENVFETLDELLAHPEIEVVDIATPPAPRIELVHRALAAGKHVLSQKPLAPSAGEARGLVEAAERAGLKLAVNHNGRWAPSWRIATLLVEQGVVGDVRSVTHLFDDSVEWTLGTHYEAIEHFRIYDFSIHWVDITRCWLDGREVAAVRAREYRTPGQPPEAKTPWGVWIEVEYADGYSALIRGVGCARTERESNPFWIHGSEGTIRGSVLSGDFVELEKDGATTAFELEGGWFPDGFAGTIGELFSAIADDREPFNSARHNLLSLEITLAACLSAERNGAAVTLDEVS